MRSVESALSSRYLSAPEEVLPRLPPKPARQSSFGSEPKRRRHDGHKFKRSGPPGGDLVAEKGKLRAEAKGGHLILMYIRISNV